MVKQNRIKRLTSYGGSRGCLTYLSLVLSAISAAISVIPFYYIWLMLEEVLTVMPDFDQAVNLVHNGWMAFGFTVISVLIYIAALMCSHLAAFRIANNIKIDLMKHAMELPPGSFDMMGSGKVRRVVQESTAATETYLAHELPDSAGSMTLPIAILVMLFFFDWRLGLASMGAVFIGAIGMMSMMNSKVLQGSMEQYQGALMNVNKEAVEYVRGVSVVKTFQQTVHTFQSFKQSILDYSKFAIGYTKWCKSRMVLFFVGVNTAFAFLIIAGLAINGGLVWSTEFILDFMFYVIFTPLIPVLLLKVMFMGQEGYIVDDALSRIDELLAMEPLSEPAVPAEPEDNTVVFDNVTFTYPENETPAVRDISLTMKPGTVTALVGPSGCGKSTIASLACRFWDPQEGTVSVGGKDVRDIGSANLGKVTAFVFQNNSLFKDTLLNNVRMGRPDASEEDIMKALELAQCSDIIAKMPDGLNTYLGPGGVYLSGGEVQRVAIARMLLKDAPIIILDEATAFADPENEYLVQKAFENLTKEKTVLMIAHRLTTVKNADNIIVLDHGTIQENGTHDELVAKGGMYSRMWKDYQETLSWKVKEAAQ